MNILDLFISLMNDLYYTGYAEDLAVNDPEKYKFELNEFLNIYGADL